MLQLKYWLKTKWKNKINYRPKKANYLFLDSPQERAIKRIQDLNDVKIPKKFSKSQIKKIDLVVKI